VAAHNIIFCGLQYMVSMVWHVAEYIKERVLTMLRFTVAS